LATFYYRRSIENFSGKKFTKKTPVPNNVLSWDKSGKIITAEIHTTHFVSVLIHKKEYIYMI